jgi:hypothetical protein
LREAVVRKRALVLLVMLSVEGCFSTEPDYVAKTRPTQCDTRSRLVRRGYPENLEVVLIDQCTVTRMDEMRGPDFTFWLSGASTAITSCDSPVRIPFWTEKSPEGKIIRIHFCPDYCLELKNRLLAELKNDVICEDAAGVAGAPATVSATMGTVAPFANPAAGSSGRALAGMGASAAGVAGVAGGAAGASGVAGAGAAGAGGGAEVSGAGGSAGASGAGDSAAGAGGSSGAAGTAGAAGTG